MRHIVRAIIAMTIAAGALLGFTGIAAADLLATHECPEGYKGVIVEVDGHYVMACQNIRP